MEDLDALTASAKIALGLYASSFAFCARMVSSVERNSAFVVSSAFGRYVLTNRSSLLT